MDIKRKKEIEIIEAAGIVFSQYGFHKAKMQKIADTANIGKGTIYEYFSSKNQLFEEMIKHFIISYISSLEDVINKSKDLEETLLEIANFHGLFIRRHIDMWNNLMGNQVNVSADMKKEIYKIKEKLLKTVSKLIRKYKDKGEVKDIDERAFVISLFGSLNLFYASGIEMEEKELNDINPKPLIDILINGIR